ncbi:recombinase family protein [Pseudonocardia alaniniphila]
MTETVTRFAFYGRVSTEDQQDPEASRNWQLARSRALTDKHGAIEAEFFDIGQSRSIPWKRRPEAARLLDALKDDQRGFDAVVIGEPQRAFYGNQYGLTYPVFQHYGVDLWVPEVGGPIDPESEAHDLVMSVFGGMSKGERNRIKIRVRSAMSAQAKVEGRFLGGRPPYGYRLADVGPHPNPAKAADGKRLKQLEPDPAIGPVVQRIYEEYLAGYGIFAIAQRLTSDGIPSPAAADPTRNPHRTGIAWSKSAIRTILTNPRYTGRQVWNKQRKQESLIDVEDVGLGHRTRLMWNAADAWITSTDRAHAALITDEVFEQVQARMRSRGTSSSRNSVVRVRRPYALRGMVLCDACGRRMQGTWNHGRAHYRCRFPNEYAIANKLQHPLAVYLREDAVLGPLDEWLADVFDPMRMDESLNALADCQPDADPALDAAKLELAACDRKLATHRAALEAGADPEMVAAWSNEVRGQREAIQARLGHQQRAQHRRLSREEIGLLVEAFGGLLAVLRAADPASKTEVYRQLGLSVTYRHEDRTATATVCPRVPVGVMVVSEGGLEPPRPLKGTSTSS